MDAGKGVVNLAMPSPQILRAPAVWITARSWTLAAVERFGDARVVTPVGTWGSIELGQLIDSMLEHKPSPARQRSRANIEARTLVKDVRGAARQIRGSRRASRQASAPTPGGPFVWQHHDPFFSLGTRLARGAGLPLVQFVDAPHVWEARRWGVRRPGWGPLLERTGEVRQLRQADLIVCVSDDVANAVADLCGPRVRVLVAPCTADPSFFELRTERAAIRRQLGYADSDVVVGWSGSFRRFHAVEHLTDAFVAAYVRDPALRLLLVGDGPDRPDLEARAAASPAREAITFVGQIPYSRMRDHVAAMDIAVLTARDPASFHYSPLKLREYRASGRAIVAPAVGQIADTLTDGDDALLYQTGRVDELAAHLATLAADAECRARLGTASRDDEIARGGALAQIDLVSRELGVS